jgi:hypothetical protein
MSSLTSKHIFLLVVVYLVISCKGDDGAIGPSGLNSIIKTTNEAAGSNCQFGGLKIESGLDKNLNSLLDSDEILKTDFVCTLAGKNSLVNVVNEPIGTNCSNAGIKIESGLDDNQDGILNPEEIKIIRYICNGVNGIYDEQIRIKIEMPLDFEAGDEFSTTSSIYISAGVGVSGFNKAFYQGVDSIVFTSNPSNFTADTRTYIELFNITNNVRIANSEISRVAIYTDKEYVSSKNIYKDLPSNTIDLGVRLRSEINDRTAYSGYPYLILYRKN